MFIWKLWEQTKIKNKSNKKQKQLLVIIILLFFVSAGILVTILYMQQSAFKVSMNGASLSNYAKDTFLIEEGKVSISIKDFATIVRL